MTDKPESLVERLRAWPWGPAEGCAASKLMTEAADLITSLLSRLQTAEARYHVQRKAATDAIELAEEAEARAETAEADNKRLREGVEFVRQSVENWFSPWGSWKTAWWEDFASDDREYNSENFIKTIGRRARSLLATPLGREEKQGLTASSAKDEPQAGLPHGTEG